jgi:hypothetical protein
MYHLIIDKNGSMSVASKETIGGFNEQLKHIKKLNKSQLN